MAKSQVLPTVLCAGPAWRSMKHRRTCSWSVQAWQNIEDAIWDPQPHFMKPSATWAVYLASGASLDGWSEDFGGEGQRTHNRRKRLSAETSPERRRRRCLRIIEELAIVI
ncbi:uncharacterized protein LOC123868224 [Maniola jurtina]|uniref:uncharacterized protein LOC123868224 n=1 Tax=Maniola jurtina TaxID=191418 RepID=UPI001E68E52F|nr:uncharacterized protein LOC123868224 [Maniola jurtina]